MTAPLTDADLDAMATSTPSREQLDALIAEVSLASYLKRQREHLDSIEAASRHLDSA